MKILNLKKVLFGLAVSLVLAMAIGSFALGEAQTPITPQAAATNDGTCDFAVTGDASSYSFNSSIGVLTISGGTHTISMAEGVALPTTQRIAVDGAATITLAGVNISAGNGPALNIVSNATFDVNILLADGSENFLKTTASQCAGLQKPDSGSTTTGTLTITGAGTLKATGGDYAAGIGSFIDLRTGVATNASNITIKDGAIVAATGGACGAGIGGGLGGNGTKITINNSIVTATGGGEEDVRGALYTAAAAIGGGGGVFGNGTWLLNPGTGSENQIDDSSILIAKGGIDAEDYSKDVLEGFGDGLEGLVFEQKTDSDVNAGTVYGNIVLTDNLTIPTNATLTIPQNNSLTINEGKTLTVPAGSVLTNEGTLTIKGTLSCTDTGKVETLLNYDFQGGDIVEANDDSYITYQDATEVKKYENMPSVEKEGYDLDGWYTKEKGQGTKVEEGDNVLLNEHTLYANWVEPGPEPTPTPPTPTPPGPEPTPTPPEPGPEPSPTPDPSVNPDGGDGGSSAKTSDPFMGGIALALLGVATTGAVLVRKRK